MARHMNRMKVLLSAYACEPGQGSEPGVGWQIARHLAQHHDVWVITRANNRLSIEAELTRHPVQRLHFIYFDLPRWARFWKQGQRGVQFYYYLWQAGAYSVAKRLHREIGFDMVQHVTFVKYWTPSFLSLLDVPFIWGPVGGGESAPKRFWPGCGARGTLYESLRAAARWLGEHDPFVLLTARRARLILATTYETALRLRRIGARKIELFSQVALSTEEVESLYRLPPPPEGPIRFLSIGRLLHWKGFHLGLTAFAQSGLQAAEYWVVGDGPERSRLERLARHLGVSDRVRFFGHVPRSEVMNILAKCHTLVHPSLHDSGGWVCVEAMAAGRPVICLDLGGPGLQVTDLTGVKVPARSPKQVIRDVAAAMRLLADDVQLWAKLSQGGRIHVKEHFIWPQKVETLANVMRTVVNER